MLKRYRTRFKEHRTLQDRQYVIEALSRSFKRVVVSQQPLRFQYASGTLVERYTAFLDGKRAGLDFNEASGEFLQITMAGKKLSRPLFEKTYGKRQSLLEASLADMFSKPKPSPTQNVVPAPMQVARGSAEPKAVLKRVSFPASEMQPAEGESQEVHLDAQKEIFSGTQIFQKAERRLRVFLSQASKKNIFCLVGPGGTGKSVAAYNALNKTCGAQLTSADIYKNLKDASFDKEEFRVRIEAREAIDKAKDFFRRYLNAAKLNKASGRHDSMFADDEHLEEQALKKAQEAVGDELYGYKLTLDDMKGGGNIARTGSDPILKLKQLGSQDASVPYNPANGWTKGSVRTSADKEIYLMLYSANARALFVDEGDDLLTKGSTIIKEAFDATKARHVSSGSNKGYLEVGNFVLPEDFWYTGKMVVNTNVPPSQWNQAVRTRAEVFPLYLSVNQLLDRLVEILPSMHKAELSQYPMAIMGIVIRFLKKAEKGIERWGRSGKFLSRTQLTQFDYRTFVQMCIEFALMIQDEIEDAKANPREGEDTSFNVEGASNAELEQWTKGAGKSIYTRALNKWKKSALMDIELMNKADADNKNVVPLQSDEEGE